MTYELIECSPKAKAKIKNYEDAIGVEEEASHQRQKYPWPLMKIGQAFTVPLAEGNEASLRNGASQFAKKTGKKFAVIRHGEYSCFECVRIA
jgi:hypothetical protein